MIFEGKKAVIYHFTCCLIFLTKGKIFFAFLDVSDHLEAKKKDKKVWEITPIS